MRATGSGILLARMRFAPGLGTAFVLCTSEAAVGESFVYTLLDRRFGLLDGCYGLLDRCYRL
eukprot:1188629-Prorocentrum_minimum.AAC.1